MRVVNVLIFQLDGKIPNIALMRIASHHRQLEDSVEFRWTGNPERFLWDKPDKVYGSAIFEKTRPAVEKLKDEFSEAIIGGTGVDIADSLEAHGISTTRPAQTIAEIWRGDPYPKHLLLLDNDFFGQPEWRERISEIRDGGFKVSFNQGINVRFITDETAEAIASIDYRDDSMKVKRIYTAWDNQKDEERLFAGLSRLTKYGVKPDHMNPDELHNAAIAKGYVLCPDGEYRKANRASPSPNPGAAQSEGHKAGRGADAKLPHTELQKCKAVDHQTAERKTFKETVPDYLPGVSAMDEESHPEFRISIVLHVSNRVRRDPTGAFETLCDVITATARRLRERLDGRFMESPTGGPRRRRSNNHNREAEVGKVPF